MRAFLFILLAICCVSCKQTVGDQAIDFLKGFLEGIEETGDIKEVLKCVEDLEKIIEEIVVALKEIMTFEIKKVIDGIAKLVVAVRKFMEMIEPCATKMPQLQKLIDAIWQADIMALFGKIMKEPGFYLDLLTKAIACFTNSDWYCLGLNTGKVLFRLFLK